MTGTETCGGPASANRSPAVQGRPGFPGRSLQAALVHASRPRLVPFAFKLSGACPSSEPEALSQSPPSPSHFKPVSSKVPSTLSTGRDSSPQTFTERPLRARHSPMRGSTSRPGRGAPGVPCPVRLGAHGRCSAGGPPPEKTASPWWTPSCCGCRAPALLQAYTPWAAPQGPGPTTSTRSFAPPPEGIPTARGEGGGYQMPLRTTTTTHEGQELVANSRSFPFGGGGGTVLESILPGSSDPRRMESQVPTQLTRQNALPPPPFVSSPITPCAPGITWQRIAGTWALLRV